jgi:hypothetical protein
LLLLLDVLLFFLKLEDSLRSNGIAQIVCSSFSKTVCDFEEENPRGRGQVTSTRNELVGIPQAKDAGSLVRKWLG